MRLLFTLIFSVSILSAHADCGNRYLDDLFEVEKIEDIKYGSNLNSEGDEVDLYLDVYRPKDDTATSRPLLIYLHGGSFINGNRKVIEVTAIAEALAKKGYVTCTINYRLEPSFISLIFPEVMIKAVMRAVQDAKAAVRFFRKDVAESGNTYGIDPEQIFIGGASAGGIAALHMAYIDDMGELTAEYQGYANEIGGLEGTSGNEGYSSKVKAVVTASSAMRDVNYMDDNTDIPVLFVHAPFDLSIPYGIGKPYGIPTLPLVYGSKPLHAHAQEIGLPSVLYKVPGNQHVPYKDNEDNLIRAVFDSTIWYMSNFMYEYIECEFPTTVKDRSTGALGIYPNPAAGGFYIEAKLSGKQTIHFYNSLGKLCRTELLESGQNFISLKEPLPPGMYLLQLFDEDESAVAAGKLVVR